MRKGSDLVGKKVIAFDSGEAFETIEDLIFDQETNTLLGFLVDESGWFSSANVIPFQNVQAIGADAVIVPSRNAEVSATQVPAIKRILERNNVLRGTKIMTTDGRDLGTIHDLYFDETTGAIEGYDVSGGVFADAYSGRSFVPAPQTVKIGEDVAFVPPEVADQMDEQVGGIKGAVQSAGDSLQESTQSGGDKLQQLTASASSSLTNAAIQPAQQKSYVLGKTVDRDVTAPDGMLLVAKDQQVTPLAADEAERQDVLDQLYRATGGSLTTGFRNSASELADNARNNVNGMVASSSVEEARGRRVQQAVTAEQGLIIAAPGQIVTDRVIERARTYQREAALLEAVGVSSGEAAGSKVSGATKVAGDRLEQATANARDNASSLWDRAKGKVDEFQERTASEAEEASIRRALGRPVNRVILDPQDNVILNVGELVTHKAVEDARRSDVLKMLLDSIHHAEPEIGQDELRAPEPGRDALEQQER